MDFWNISDELLTSVSRIMYWRPLVTVTYAADWNLGDGSPLMFHLTNTILHGLVGGLAFVVLRRWIGAIWPAFFAALLFAVHPTKAESVAWISGRTDILCMLAVLVATIGIGRRIQHQRGGILLEVLGTVAAYLSKEQAVVLPLFVGVETWVAAGRPGIDFGLIRTMLRNAIPQILAVLFYISGRALWMPFRSGSDASLSPLDHLLVVLETMGRFFMLTFAPHDLSIQQGLVQLVDGRIQHAFPYVALGAVGLALLCGLALASFRRRPEVTVGISLYLAALLPTSNVVHSGAQTLVSERFLYLPVFGLALLVGVMLKGLDPRHRKLSFGIVAVAILALGLSASVRAGDFSDEEKFWERELALHPDSDEAHLQRFGRAMEAKRYLRALAGLNAYKDRSDGRELDIFKVSYHYTEVLSRLIPDRDTKSLEELDRFCDDLMDSQIEVATLDWRGTSLRVRKTRFSQKDVARYHALLWSLRANLAMRLGRTPESLAHAENAGRYCAGCTFVVITKALALAADGRIEEGLAALERGRRGADKRLVAARAQLEKARTHQELARTAEGPQALIERANELSALELWGRAFEVLAPYENDIREAPEVALGFAELAFRAGEVAVARRVLGHGLSAAAVEEHLQGWSDKMGWRD